MRRARGGRPRGQAASIAVAAMGAVVVVAALAALVLPARVRSATRVIVVETDPVDLPAHASHHDVAQPAVRAVTLPADGWLRGYTVDLVDARGRAVPRGVLHHVNLIAPERRELFSPIMQRLGAAGPETAPVALPRLLGAPVRRGDSLVVTAMLHNPTDTAYRGVRLRVRMPYVRAGPAVRVVAVYPFYVDVMPPAGEHDFDLPPGRSVTWWEGRPAVRGVMLGVGGHLHRYGVALRFEDRTARRTLWATTPRTDAAGEVVAVPTRTFLRSLGVPLDPAHVYRLSVVYENPTGATIPRGGMGTLGGVFLPAAGAAWPRVARHDPQYRRDVAVTWRVGHAHGAHGAHHDAAPLADDAGRTRAR